MDSIISQHVESKAIKFQREGERERKRDSRECIYKEEDDDEEATEKEPCWNIFPLRLIIN